MWLEKKNRLHLAWYWALGRASARSPLLRRRFSWQNSMLITSSQEKRSSNFEAHRLARSSVRSNVGRYVWLLDPPEGLGIPRPIVI